MEPKITSGSYIPGKLLEESGPKMQEQRVRLEHASKDDYLPPDMGVYEAKHCKNSWQREHGQCGHVAAPLSRFAAVQVEIPLSPPLIDHVPVEEGQDEWQGTFGDKNLALKGLKERADCLIYSMGVATNSIFEEAAATKLGCEVHAFDCTVKEDDSSVKGKNFHFHQWCIGDSSASEQYNADTSNQYVEHVLDGTSDAGLKFKSLEASMKELGHTSLDVLKFDIEGFEWKFFESELFKGIVKPRQLLFEMHTEGAKPWSVPPENVKGRADIEVNKAFLKLHEMGYRVVSKELNEDDKACAEFVMVIP